MAIARWGRGWRWDQSTSRPTPTSIHRTGEETPIYSKTRRNPALR